MNDRTGRMGKHYKCADCLKDYPASTVQVDHIDPIINPKTGFTTWDEVVNNMFCEVGNLQVLCLTCHCAKTAQEKEISKQYLKERKINAE